MDGIEGTMKNLVFRDVKLAKCIIETPKDFAQYTNKSIKRVSSLNVPTSDVMQEPDSIENAPKIPNTLEIHKIKKGFRCCESLLN